MPLLTATSAFELGREYARVCSTLLLLLSLYRMATNLEKPGILGNSLNLENSWNSQGILCNLREKL